MTSDDPGRRLSSIGQLQKNNAELIRENEALNTINKSLRAEISALRGMDTVLIPTATDSISTESETGNPSALASDVTSSDSEQSPDV